MVTDAHVDARKHIAWRGFDSLGGLRGQGRNALLHDRFVKRRRASLLKHTVDVFRTAWYPQTAFKPGIELLRHTKRNCSVMAPVQRV